MTVKFVRPKIPHMRVGGIIPAEMVSSLFIECRDLDQLLWGDLSERPAFIYAIKDPSGTFYVGSTISPIGVRLAQHLADIVCGRHVNSLFTRTVRAAGFNNITIELLEETTEAYRFIQEGIWIQRLRDQGKELVNKANPAKSLVWLKRDTRRQTTQRSLYLLFYKSFEMIVGLKPIANHWQEILIQQIRAKVPEIVGHLRVYYQALFGETYFKILYDFATRYIYHPL